MDTTTSIIAISSALVGALLGWVIAHIRGEIKALQKDMAELRAMPKRHTYATSAGLEDALAVLLDIQFRRDAETARLAQAMEILRQVRGGPLNYDQDRQATARPKGWDR